jgi:hypothetical protein
MREIPGSGKQKRIHDKDDKEVLIEILPGGHELRFKVPSSIFQVPDDRFKGLSTGILA